MITNNHPLTIIFDFGNVLIDWDPHRIYRRWFDTDQEIDRFLAEIHFYEWNTVQDAGRPFAEGVSVWCQRYPQYCELIRAYDEYYEESLVGPIQPVVNILQRLHRAGYPLYGLSNWNADKFRLVRSRFAFLDCLDGIVLSGEVGLTKPDPRIFQILLERANRRPQECLLIDDSAKNIAVAQQLGFKTIHFRSPDQLQTELDRHILAVNGQTVM